MILRKLKKVGIMTMTIAICSIFTQPVSASSLLEDIGITENSLEHAEDTKYSLLKGNNLNYGHTEISKLSSMEVNVSGITQCHRVCDKVYLDLSLEQKSGGSYYTYKSWEFEVNNATQLSKSFNVIVPSGYYYRVRGYHATTEGGTKESTSTLTSGISVN